jgi:hypothetical protein
MLALHHACAPYCSSWCTAAAAAVAAAVAVWHSLLDFSLSMAPENELHADFYGQAGDTYYGGATQLQACMLLRCLGAVNASTYCYSLTMYCIPNCMELVF